MTATCTLIISAEQYERVLAARHRFTSKYICVCKCWESTTKTQEERKITPPQSVDGITQLNPNQNTRQRSSTEGERRKQHKPRNRRKHHPKVGCVILLVGWCCGCVPSLLGWGSPPFVGGGAFLLLFVVWFCVVSTRSFCVPLLFFSLCGVAFISCFFGVVRFAFILCWSCSALFHLVVLLSFSLFILCCFHRLVLWSASIKMVDEDLCKEIQQEEEEHM